MKGHQASPTRAVNSRRRVDSDARSAADGPHAAQQQRFCAVSVPLTNPGRHASEQAAAFRHALLWGGPVTVLSCRGRWGFWGLNCISSQLTRWKGDAAFAVMVEQRPHSHHSRRRRHDWARRAHGELPGVYPHVLFYFLIWKSFGAVVPVWCLRQLKCAFVGGAQQPRGVFTTVADLHQMLTFCQTSIFVCFHHTTTCLTKLAGKLDHHLLETEADKCS